MPGKSAYTDLLLVTGLILLVLIGLGLGAKLFSDRQPVSAAESAAIVEQSELMTQQLQDQLTEELANQPPDPEQERIDSPMGQALLRNCLEWTEFHDNHPDNSTQTNRDVACAEYSTFIATGTVPR